ncbi:hypothetical protein [Streptomyces sp. NPDC059278]|uniref:hypothetical protein n=1 Tax=Streptomyces sp. NPDC059278 TaxID=3346801 RepID=UPI0036956B9C
MPSWFSPAPAPRKKPQADPGLEGVSAAEHAESVIAEAGFRPLEEYKSLRAAWAVQCVTCGKCLTVLLSWFLAGKSYSCSHDPAEASPGTGRTSQEGARGEALAAGFLPEEDFPGSVQKRWLLRCVCCGRRRANTLSNIRAGYRCAHKRRSVDAPGKVSSEFCESDPKQEGPA